jgi:hypothetical protein
MKSTRFRERTTMAIAKIEPPPNSEMGSKIVPWGKRHAAGKELRRAVPRESYAEWKCWKHRPDPLNPLAANNRGRQANLIPLRISRQVMKANVAGGVRLHIAL